MRKYFYLLMTDQRNDPGARLFKVVLRWVSYFYGLLVLLAQKGYQSGLRRVHRLDRKVISVGNITWGGAGKTPGVILLAQWLWQKGYHPAILTRGYMPRGQRASQRRGLSDEARLLEDHLKDIPVLVGKNRIETARRALQRFSIDVFILDDGFQHWRLARDLDIVLVDATNPFGNGFLLPRGILREPLSALSRAELFIITKSDLGEKNIPQIQKKIQEMNPLAPVLLARHLPVSFHRIDRGSQSIHDIDLLRGKTMLSFCSIADPDSFELTLKNLGGRVIRNLAFLDHYLYTPVDLKKIFQNARDQKVDCLVTTQKDAVKLDSLLMESDPHLPLYYLKIQMGFVTGEETIEETLTRLLNKSC